MPDGADGELVFTTLTKEAMPLLRYRTGDIASLTREPCACGRTFARMSAVRGRRDDMLIVRGVNLYPSQIEHVLLRVDGHRAALPAGRRAARAPRRDHRPLRAGRAAPRASPSASRARSASEIGVSVTVEVLEPGAVPRSEGKAVRVIDKR